MLSLYITKCPFTLISVFDSHSWRNEDASLTVIAKDSIDAVSKLSLEG